jgi:hypothetical protein
MQKRGDNQKKLGETPSQKKKPKRRPLKETLREGH